MNLQGQFGADFLSNQMNVDNLRNQEPSENQNRNYMNKISSRWTQSEDEKLMALVEKHGTKNWKKITEYLDHRTAIQCFYRWNKVLKLKKFDKPFSKEEDEVILEFVNKVGFSKWTECTKILKNRTSKQIKEHWYKNLANEDSLLAVWTPDDELRLLNIVCLYGTCWSKIKKIFKFKNENTLKNKFYSILRRVANQKLNGKENLVEKVNVVTLKIVDLVKYIPDAIESLKQSGAIENFDNFDMSVLENINMKAKKPADENNSCQLRENLVEQLNIERLKENLLSKTYSECHFEENNNATAKKLFFCGKCKDVLKKKIKERIITMYNLKKVEKIKKMIEDIKTNTQQPTIDKLTQLKNLLVVLKKDLNYS